MPFEEIDFKKISRYDNGLRTDSLAGWYLPEAVGSLMRTDSRLRGKPFQKMEVLVQFRINGDTVIDLPFIGVMERLQGHFKTAVAEEVERRVENLKRTLEEVFSTKLDRALTVAKEKAVAFIMAEGAFSGEDVYNEYEDDDEA
jgi:hypothetical protein